MPDPNPGKPSPSGTQVPTPAREVSSSPATVSPAPPAPSGAPTIFASSGGDSLLFEVLTPMWSDKPRGSTWSENQLGGPDNVARLVSEGAIQPVGRPA